MFSDPERIVDQLSLTPGSYVADFGAGSGFYSLAAAKRLSGSGKVYAVDVQKELLSKIRVNAIQGHIHNIEIIWGDIEKLGGTHLKEASLDWVFCANVLFQIKNKDIVITEISRVLKKTGRLLMVDWKDSYGGIGPSAEMVFTEPMARNIFEKHGFKYDKSISAGSHHYGIIFKKI